MNRVYKFHILREESLWNIAYQFCLLQWNPRNFSGLNFSRYEEKPVKVFFSRKLQLLFIIIIILLFLLQEKYEKSKWPSHIIEEPAPLLVKRAPLASRTNMPGSVLAAQVKVRRQLHPMHYLLNYLVLLKLSSFDYYYRLPTVRLISSFSVSSPNKTYYVLWWVPLILPETKHLLGT